MLSCIFGFRVLPLYLCRASYSHQKGRRHRLEDVCVFAMPVRILIADDNPLVRTALHHLLESVDHWEILDAANGREAVAQALQFRPNLIILDLVMPVMDGLAAAREISKLLPEIPLVMHTLHLYPQVELEAQKVGARKVVPKADSKGLVAAIQQLLATNPPAASAGPTVVPTDIPPPDVAALPAVADAENSTASDKPDAGEPGEAA
jgi:CheY-like chemotaxis protein